MFMLFALLNVVGYSLLANKVREYFKSNTFIKSFNVTGGLGSIGAGLFSATIEVKQMITRRFTIVIGSIEKEALRPQPPYQI